MNEFGDETGPADELGDGIEIVLGDSSAASGGPGFIDSKGFEPLPLELVSTALRD